MEINALNAKNSKQSKQPENDNMMKPPFFTCLAAPRGSGKSNLILNLLTRKDMLKGVFHTKDIFIFSPTADVNNDFEDIKCNLISNFSDEIIMTIIEKQRELIKKHGQSKTTPLLIVLDDCLGEKKFATMNSACETLAIKGRHLLISVILVSQSLKRISRTIRLNSDYMIIFKPKNNTEYEAFAEEFIEKYNHKSAVKVLKEIFEKPYSFLLVDLKTTNDKMRFRVNFSDPISFDPSPKV